ncbi:hypothetical protein FDP41_008797 [Naegleria fowleri]|uniref:Uncharacterized protein n=1 Tax=Naegleria fowleri TaxID=5763 RepID=A0A6A5BG01_NAEFO|nr:uncharacterized protein FDP41_008797 [Naegleria fowleri]KAF0972945.1 hypothetical protein FDP41_008797 [Naegleria fowleri]
MDTKLRTRSSHHPSNLSAPSTTLISQLQEWIQWFKDELELKNKTASINVSNEDSLPRWVELLKTKEDRIKKGLIVILKGMQEWASKDLNEESARSLPWLLSEALSCIYDERGLVFQCISHHYQHSVRELLLKLEQFLSKIVSNGPLSLDNDPELFALFSQFYMMALMFRLQNYDLLMLQPQSFEELARNLSQLFIKPDTQKEMMLSYLVDPLFECDKKNSPSLQIGSISENVRRRCRILKKISFESKDSQIKLELLFESLHRNITPQVTFQESLRRNLEQAIQAFFEPLSLANLSHHSLIETVDGMKKKVFLTIIHNIATCSEEEMRSFGVMESSTTPQITTHSEKPRKKKQKQEATTLESASRQAFQNVLSNTIDAMLNVLECNIVFSQKLLHDVFAIIKVLATTPRNKQRIELLMKVMDILRKHLSKLPTNSANPSGQQQLSSQSQYLQYGLFLRSAFCFEVDDRCVQHEPFEM